MLDLATELARTEAARRILEDRHLAGRGALSPAALAAWGQLRTGVNSLMESIPSLPRGRRRPDGHAIWAAAERTAPGEARALVDRARAQALDLLGDHAGAAAILEEAQRSRP